MKRQCSDCEAYEFRQSTKSERKVRGQKPEIINKESGDCHLNPRDTDVQSIYWCMQFVEKTK